MNLDAGSHFPPEEVLLRIAAARLEASFDDSFEVVRTPRGPTLSALLKQTREFPQEKLEGIAHCTGQRCFVLLMAHSGAEQDKSWLKIPRRTGSAK